MFLDLGISFSFRACLSNTLCSKLCRRLFEGPGSEKAAFPFWDRPGGIYTPGATCLVHSVLMVVYSSRPVWNERLKSAMAAAVVSIFFIVVFRMVRMVVGKSRV